MKACLMEMNWSRKRTQTEEHCVIYNMLMLLYTLLSNCMGRYTVRCVTDDVYFPDAFESATGPDPCILAHNPRYRKGPDVCFDNNIDVS